MQSWQHTTKNRRLKFKVQQKYYLIKKFEYNETLKPMKLMNSFTNLLGKYKHIFLEQIKRQIPGMDNVQVKNGRREEYETHLWELKSEENVETAKLQIEKTEQTRQPFRCKTEPEKNYHAIKRTIGEAQCHHFHKSPWKVHIFWTCSGHHTML